MKPWRRLVDLFWWGGAITHCASESYKRGTVLYNELDPSVYNLFRDIWEIMKDVEEISRVFITREKFIEVRDQEIRTSREELLLLCNGFWNNQKNYMYWKKIENRKHLLHNLHFGIGINNQEDLDAALSELSESRLFFDRYKIYYKIDYIEYKSIGYFRSKIRNYATKRIDTHWQEITEEEIRIAISEKKASKKENYQLQSLESLERLQSLQRLESLERLEGLERLESLGSLQSLESLERLERLQSITYSNISRENVWLQVWDIIYCDPPYEDTGWYSIWWIDYDKFWQFVRDCPYPCYVSWYKWPSDLIQHKTTKIQNLSKSKDNSKQTEIIFYNWK